MMGESKDSDSTVYSEHVVVGCEAGTRTGETVIGVSEGGGGVGRDCDESVDIGLEGVGILSRKEKEVGCVEEKVVEEVKERVVQMGGGCVDAVKQGEGVSDVEVRNEGSLGEDLGGVNQAGLAGKDSEFVRDDVVDARKVDEEGGLSGPEMVASHAAASVNDENVEKPDTEYGASSMVDGDSVMGGVKDMEEDRVEKSVGGELVDSNIDERDVLKAHKGGAFGTEVQCGGPGTPDAFISSSLQNIEEISAVVVNKEVMVSKDYISVNNALECCAFGSDRPGRLGDEGNCTRMTKDTETSMQPIVEHGQIIVDGEVVKITEGQNPCSDVEDDSNVAQKMNIDKKVTHIVQVSHDCLEKRSDEEELKVATDDVRDESQTGGAIVSSPLSQVVDEPDIILKQDKFLSGPNAKALNPSCLGNGETGKAESDCEDKTADTQIIDSGVSLMETEEALNITSPGISAKFTEDHYLKSKECLDNHPFGHVSQTDSAGKGMEVEEQVDEDKLVGSGIGEEEMEAKSDENGEDQGRITVVQPTQVVEGRVELGNNIPLLTGFNVPMSVDADGMALCQVHDQKLGAEIMDRSTKANTQDVTKEKVIVVDGQQVLDSAGSAAGSKEAEEQSKSDTLLHNCVRHDSQSVSVQMQEIVVEKQTNEAKQLSLRKDPETVVGEIVNDADGLHGEEEMMIEEHAAAGEPHENIEEENVRLVALKPRSSVRVHQASYLLPPVEDDKLLVSNLVWGKVRSHPWWPGQIFDISDSSEQAMKYHKKDCFLVAYFGDRTFAWNDASQLKPFRQHFSQIEKHSHAESFQNAVTCALEEIARRIQLGLACSCMAKDVYEKIRFQRVENAGIHPESSIRADEDKSQGVDFFEPINLLKYMKALARMQSGGANLLELEIAKAQLLSFYRLKGYCMLPEVQFCGELLERGGHLDPQEDTQLNEANGQEIPNTEDEKFYGVETEKRQGGSYHKRKHNLKEGLYQNKKQRSGSELISETAGFPDDDSLSGGKIVGKTAQSYSGKKRKASEPIGDDPDVLYGKKTTSFARVSQSPAPVPSFKIGNRICRVASQLTGPPILKNNTERSKKLDGSSNEPTMDDFDVFLRSTEEANGKRSKNPGECTSLDDLLSQLHSTAQDPFKEHSSLNIVISFFSDFRNSVIAEQPITIEEIDSRRKKSSLPVGDPETFEFEVEDVNDSYWTDRVIENGSEEEPSQRKRKRDHQYVPVELAKSPETNKRSYTKKRNSYGASDVGAEKTTVHIREKTQDLAPTELLMFFPGVDCIPSETNLNRTFRRFGPLWESETEIDQETNRARVIFKRCSDAEVAYNSAGRFKIFGALSVNYQLSYTPSIPFKTLPPATTEGQAMPSNTSTVESQMNLVAHLSG